MAYRILETSYGFAGETEQTTYRLTDGDWIVHEGTREDCETIMRALTPTPPERSET